MARYEELKNKYPNYRFNGDKPYCNKKRQANSTVLVEKRTREIGNTIKHWIAYLDTLKDKYPQFDKIKLSVSGEIDNGVLVIIGEMLETDELYEERCIIENEKLEFFTLHQERKKKIKEQEELNYYYSLYNKFGGKNPQELVIAL